jgi:DNA mismatch repair protein MutL
MNRVRLLPEQVANQIAAGEVVERPASVVKELVENALDAGAGRIVVEIQAGGRAMIRVTDDGTGMSRDDALMSLERHATSKIKTAQDLHAITTMGFRGEALPSLASVSRMTMTSREREGASPEATQIVIHGGKILEVKAAGAPTGTCIEARQLFYNLPARRKFLRSEETERAHIQHYLILAALANPAVAFTFIQEGRTVWQLPGIASAPEGHPFKALLDRLHALYGTEERFIQVDHEALLPIPAFSEGEPPEEPRQLVVWGFAGEPGVSRSTRENQHLFVNRRPVENRGLNFALLEGYHNALMKGRYPVCCLFLEIDPMEVDVNIHPAKREVKFRREQAVRQIVSQAVRHALLEHHAAGQAAAAAMVATPNPAFPSAPAPAPEITHTAVDLPIFQAAARDVPTMPPTPAVPVVNPPQAHQEPLLPQTAFRPPVPGPSKTVPPFDAAPVPLLDVPLRMVGVLGRLYVVLESDRGLVLLDQHAAHERVLYEQMLARADQGQAPSQRLLLPDTIELSARDAQFLREQLPLLNRLGVGLSEFGERTYLLDALPPFAPAGNARQFVLDILDELKAAGQSVNSWRLGENVVAKTVCRHAVKARDPLTEPEILTLIEDLRRCAMPYTCPHGRPTLIELNFRELEKRFGRVV